MSEIEYNISVTNISHISYDLSGSGGRDDQEYAWLYELTDMIWTVYSPILLLVGITGNTLSFMALMGQALQPRVSSIFLRALSVADTMALVFGLLPVWPKYMKDYDITTKHDAICKLRNFLFYTFSDISVWLICAFTFDRLVAVVFPFRKKMICTRRNAYIAIIVVFSLSVIKNFETLVTRRVLEHNVSHVSACRTPDSDHNFYNEYVRPWVVFASVSAIPFVFITSCNIVIIRSFYKMQRIQAVARMHCTSKKPSSQVASMTRMCLMVSCAFLLLVCPSIIILIGRPYWNSSPTSKARYYFAKGLGSMCQYTNNSINFLLYCGSGQVFREELTKVMTCSQGRKPPLDTYIYSHEASTCVNNANRMQGGHSPLMTHVKLNDTDMDTERTHV